MLQDSQRLKSPDRDDESAPVTMSLYHSSALHLKESTGPTSTSSPNKAHSAHSGRKQQSTGSGLVTTFPRNPTNNPNRHPSQDHALSAPKSYMTTAGDRSGVGVPSAAGVSPRAGMRSRSRMQESITSTSAHDYVSSGVVLSSAGVRRSRSARSLPGPHRSAVRSVLSSVMQTYTIPEE